MSSITSNEAAWIPTEKATCEVGPGPVPKPTENEVVIEVAYAAVNPIDYLMQDTPYVPLPYPSIFGSDIAGTIVQLGSSVTRFMIGQRVIGECDNLLTQNPSHAGFQRFATCAEIMVAAIPDSLPLANAAVLPLCYSTAGCALFKHLRLPLPSLDPKPIEKTILLWGGSSSVGCSAIQLAVAAGLTVVTTAGAQNHDLVTSLGAKHVIDYNSPTVIEEVLKVLKTGDLVVDFNGGDPVLVDLDIGDALWRKYLPEALATGKFVPKPDPEIIEGGLGKVQEGIDIVGKGVSAKKIVIEVAKEA
ncbi:hypothetical protein N7467_008584 [Penicillium canescens]|nr:hypothetical protein N7467_008584 [Penicillium canescens]